LKFLTVACKKYQIWGKCRELDRLYCDATQKGPVFRVNFFNSFVYIFRNFCSNPYPFDRHILPYKVNIGCEGEVCATSIALLKFDFRYPPETQKSVRRVFQENSNKKNCPNFTNSHPARPDTGEVRQPKFVEKSSITRDS
jgi:hypothetical protein